MYVRITSLCSLLVNFGILATLGSHALLAFTKLTPFVSMVSLQQFNERLADSRLATSLQTLMGFSYSVLACALWPMVAYVVPEHHLGTAYGMLVIMYCVCTEEPLSLGPDIIGHFLPQNRVIPLSGVKNVMVRPFGTKIFTLIIEVFSIVSLNRRVC